MRPEIEHLVHIGRLPSEHAVSVEPVREVEVALLAITKPVSNEEARALVNLFGPDNFYGLAWTILHLVESAPDWPLADCLTDLSNEWVALLRERAVRGHS